MPIDCVCDTWGILIHSSSKSTIFVYTFSNGCGCAHVCIPYPPLFVAARNVERFVHTLLYNCDCKSVYLDAHNARNHIYSIELWRGMLFNSRLETNLQCCSLLKISPFIKGPWTSMMCKCVCMHVNIRMIGLKTSKWIVFVYIFIIRIK